MEQHSKLPSGDFPLSGRRGQIWDYSFMIVRRPSSHIRGLGEFSVQWVYTKKEVSNMEIAYIKCGDYYIPDLTSPEETRPIGK